MSQVVPHGHQEAWVARFFRRLDGLGVVVREEPYARPEAGGTTMAYRLTPPGELHGRIVFAHATGNDGLFPQAELFLSWLVAGFEIFTFDLDGHGARSTTVLSAQSVPTMISQAVAQANRQGPTLPMHGAGQSLGAALWLSSASRETLSLTSLVLFSAPIAVDLGVKAGLSEFSALMTREFWQERCHYGWAGIIPPLGPWRRRAYPIRMMGEERKSGDKYDRVYSLNYPQHIARLILSLDIASVVSRITVPTLLIYGARDKIVSPAQGQRLVQSMTHARCLQIPGATHYTTPLHAQSLSESTGWLLGARVRREG